MASAMRKMAVYLGLVEDEGRYDDYDRDHRYDRYDADGRYDDGYDIDDQYDADDDDGDSRPAAGDRHASGSHSMAVHDRHQRSERPERGGVATLADRRPGPAPVTPAPAPTSARGLDRITTIHPRTYNEAKQIGESFRSGTPVIMNLTDMDDADAKRLVDFAAGLVFGLRGTIERVTAKVFLLSPANVTVTAEAKARMAESGFFNQS